MRSHDCLSDDLRSMLRVVLVPLDEIRGELRLLLQALQAPELNAILALYRKPAPGQDEEPV